MKRATFLILLGVVIQSGTRSLPSYIVPCGTSDEICLKKNLHSLRPHLLHGIKKLQLPSVVPLHVPDFNVTKNAPADLVHTAALTNAQCIGVNNYEVSKINIDLDRFKFLLALNFPQLTFTFDEKVSGKIFGLDANWDGTGQITYNNVTIIFSLNGKQVIKEEKEHVIWKKDSIDDTVASTFYDFENLINDKEIEAVFTQKSDQIRRFFDWEITLILKNTLAESIFRFINVVHETFPIDVLYANE